MLPFYRVKTTTAKLGFIFGLFCWCISSCFATERWQIVVLPDNHYQTPNELPALTDVHSTISQGLTIALNNADFDVLNNHSLGLPNCILEDCAKLTDQSIRQAAIQSGKEANLALLYQITAFQQRHGASQQWYFNLSGRLLDLQSSTQQDAFAVDNHAPAPAVNCINECLSQWLNQHLALLAQDLGAVLSEKLTALPRRFHYQIQLNKFNSEQLQQIDAYLKNIQGYTAHTLLNDSRVSFMHNAVNEKSWVDHPDIGKDGQESFVSESLAPEQRDPQLIQPTEPLQHNKIQRSYQYISELTASELSLQLDKLNQHFSAPLIFEYDNTDRQFEVTLTNVIQANPNALWQNFSQFMAGLFSNFSLLDPDTETLQAPSSDTSPKTEQEPTKQNTEQISNSPATNGNNEAAKDSDEAITAQKDQQMWQQAQSVNTIESYQYYLTTWPLGQNVILAQDAINKLQDDHKHWLQASSQDTNQAYQIYLSQRPQGQYKQQARLQLAKLREQQQLLQKQQQNKALADDYYQQQDYPEALYFYQQGAKIGDRAAQYLLAKMYQQAQGTAVNLHQAATWYTQAAKQGHDQAQAALGVMYAQGDGVKQNYSQAIYWYQKAAQQGHRQAQYQLAYLYSYEQGVVKNYSQAAYWFEKAALQGHMNAQNNLGKLYERGLGVNQDLNKAKQLYQQAAAQGHQMARVNLRMLKD